MALSVSPATFDELERSWKEVLPKSATDTVFVTPCWQRIWWDHFRGADELTLLAVRDGGDLAAVAPLRITDDSVAFVGNTEVCDYLDFVAPAERCSTVLDAVLGYLEPLSWSTLVLHSLPSDSPTRSFFRDLPSRSPGYAVETAVEDVCPRLDLVSDWEQYLARLTKKDRHELRRKFRRLASAGSVHFYRSQGAEALDRDLDDFFRLHRNSREDKAAFMTPGKEQFFREAVSAFAAAGIARLFFLEVDGVRTASVICFDYGPDRLLYNSGYDPEYAPLSAGLLLKAHCIRDAAESGKRRFDFLRGNEPYKYDLGGVDYSVYTCTVRRR